MDFSWTDKQLEQKEKAVQLGRSFQFNNADLFPRDAWKCCADNGIFKLGLPSEYSGDDEQDIMTAVLMMEGLGYGCSDNGFTFGLNAQIWTTQLPISSFGSEEQKNYYLPKMVSGNYIMAHALSEPEAGSDVFSMQMTAKKVNSQYCLDGVKHLISLAPVADCFLVFASTNPKLGKWGVSAFLVERDTPGLEISEPVEKMGLSSIPFGSLTFNKCMVDKEARLAKEGSGFALSTSSLEYERCGILASHLGAMERQLEKTIEYAKERHQFGQPIGSFQSVSNRIADMKVRLEAARLLLYKVAWLKQNNQSTMLESSMLKLFLSEAFVESSMDAIRIHGGRGYLVSEGVEGDLRDSIGGVLYAGTSDIQRKIITGMLGL